MPLSELAGNKALVARLARLSRTDRLPQSLLLCGPEGVGKLACAIALAQALNCLEAPGEGCGRCPTCRRIERGEHPDVAVVRPEGPGGQMKAEAVRRVVSESPFRPFEGRKRVYIFEQADRMNPTAGNTLLKTLEEPPPATTLVLVSSQEAAILPTLLSRCQIFRFAPLAPDEVVTLLSRDKGLSPDEARLLAPLSGGSLKKALELSPETVAELRREALTIAAIPTETPSLRTLVPWADRLSKQKELLLMLSILQGLFRDLASAASGGSFIHRDLEEELAPLSERAPLGVWTRAYDETTKAIEDLRDRYLNKRITLSRLMQELADTSRW